ncbi:hypothetical protein DUI87_24874 [Hirundo rustica rustica]|uniref:Uncharacterized protein n=1 Tax=Hirundo rustica rustica TaxID=333673 RepID=A0A3M0JUQ3_HIRRU|nr:hypothetical protein DUI87_24874 [Hirundo rustica rustica]
MTGVATSDSSQPHAAISDKASHVPGYVSWNVATRCEGSSSSPMEFIWNLMSSSGVLLQGGVEKLERVLWRWTLVPMRRYKQLDLVFLTKKKPRAKLIAAYRKHGYSNKGTKLFSRAGQWP